MLLPKPVEVIMACFGVVWEDSDLDGGIGDLNRHNIENWLCTKAHDWQPMRVIESDRRRVLAEWRFGLAALVEPDLLPGAAVPISASSAIVPWTEHAQVIIFVLSCRVLGDTTKSPLSRK